MSETSILVVDDEENLLVLLDRILSKEGYVVRTAHDTQRALELVAVNEFRAAVLDIKMFPVDGVTLLGMIRARAPAIQVVMITAYPTADSRAESMQKGAAAYLTKPLDIAELKRVLRTLTA